LETPRQTCQHLKASGSTQTNILCLKTEFHEKLQNKEKFLGGSSPLCAITSITNDIRYTSQTQQKCYYLA